MINQDQVARFDTVLNFLYQLGHKQKVMYINSNEILIQNQLAMSRLSHKLMHILKPFNFYQCGTTPTFILQQKYKTLQG